MARTRNRFLSLSFFSPQFRTTQMNQVNFQVNAAMAGNPGCREHNEVHNARWNSSRLPLMPHRPLFVSQCHHFSPVIYFIAISVSLLPPPPPLHYLLFFFTCALSFSPSPLAYTHSLLLSHPLTRPHRVHEHLLARNSPPNHTTQFRSPHPLLEALLYISISVSFSLFLLLRARTVVSFSLSLALPRTSGISTNARKREKEREIERSRKSDRENERERR